MVKPAFPLEALAIEEGLWQVQILWVSRAGHFYMGFNQPWNHGRNGEFSWGENAGVKQFKPQRSWKMGDLTLKQLVKLGYLSLNLNFTNEYWRWIGYHGVLMGLTIDSVRMQINHQQLGWAILSLIVVIVPQRSERCWWWRWWCWYMLVKGLFSFYKLVVCLWFETLLEISR